MLPGFAQELAYGRRTYNSRSETVDKLSSFRDSWKHGRRCVIPAKHVYEPNWETGKAVRRRVQQPSQVPMGIAGIYRQWRGPDGGHLWSFAMFTVNADGHPVYSRFHKPGDEKRMIVILDPKDYDRWLTCNLEEAPSFFKQRMGPLDASPAPAPPRKRAA